MKTSRCVKANGHVLTRAPTEAATSVAVRVILRGPVAGAVERASLHRLVESASRPVVVEDPFATVDLQAQGLVPGSLSVMWAGPLTADAIPALDRPGVTVCRVGGEERRLLDADRIVVEGFPLTSYQPYRPGRLLPPGLLRMPHMSRGDPAPACPGAPFSPAPDRPSTSMVDP
jgi:hypothetical protein